MFCYVSAENYSDLWSKVGCPLTVIYMFIWNLTCDNIVSLIEVRFRTTATRIKKKPTIGANIQILILEDVIQLLNNIRFFFNIWLFDALHSCNPVVISFAKFQVN